MSDRRRERERDEERERGRLSFDGVPAEGRVRGEEAGLLVCACGVRERERVARKRVCADSSLVFSTRSLLIHPSSPGAIAASSPPVSPLVPLIKESSLQLWRSGGEWKEKQESPLSPSLSTLSPILNLLPLRLVSPSRHSIHTSPLRHRRARTPPAPSCLSQPLANPNSRSRATRRSLEPRTLASPSLPPLFSQTCPPLSSSLIHRRRRRRARTPPFPAC